MQVLIKETGETKNLSCNDGAEYDIVRENDPDIGFDDGQALMSQEQFDWWAATLEAVDILARLKKRAIDEIGYEATHEAIENAESSDDIRVDISLKIAALSDAMDI